MSGTPFSIIIGRVDKRPSFAPAKPALVKWHRSRPGARALRETFPLPLMLPLLLLLLYPPP
ncbi:hypothetical protein T07_13611 [Trichinella nelsoni]|uniref:Uncharacterized protein n=1 Tax=Trichinella nelsoni TaxID=6336 RepID=A0A0V0SCH5_9BILA|nr:hypothetical protein T07_13611 [Trichinella nelsoni]